MKREPDMPARHDATRSALSESVLEDLLPPRLRVLVVEDEAVSAMYLDDLLSGLGCEVVATADTAATAIAAAEAHRPDVVFMDVRLREGDGIEAAAAIRDRFGIPFVLATAYADEETHRRIAAAEPLAYLVKPVALGAIQRILETAEALVAKNQSRGP
jgi:CheY-like chemotaxis protein